MANKRGRGFDVAWSQRQVASAAGVSAATVRSLQRMGLLRGRLWLDDVVVVRSLVAVGAARPTNRSDADGRTLLLQARDRAVESAVRSALARGAPGEDVWVVAGAGADGDVMVLSDPFALAGHVVESGRAGHALVVLPVSAWVGALRADLLAEASAGHRSSDGSP